jgi:hypothetical protein
VLAQEKRSFEIDRHHRVPKLFSRLFERGTRINSSIVYKHIKAAELANGRFHGSLALSFIPHVGGLKKSNSATLPYLSRGIFAAARLQICQHHTGTFGSQTQGTPPADA